MLVHNAREPCNEVSHYSEHNVLYKPETLQYFTLSGVVVIGNANLFEIKFMLCLIKIMLFNVTYTFYVKFTKYSLDKGYSLGLVLEL